MDRNYYLDLAAGGLRMPIGTHLVLQEYKDHEEVILDGDRLGGVVAQTADRFNTPLAVPLMDLKLEKEALLEALGIPAVDIESFHFDSAPNVDPAFHLTPRMKATCDAIAHVAKKPGLVPMGMGIGPFSLMTKLVADPIAPVYLAGTGLTVDEDPEVALVERAIEIGTRIILEYFTAQIDAGAKAIIVCEPAANLVYFSPKQLENGFEIFDRYVTEPMRRVKSLLDSRGVDLVFHDCGELTDGMVERFRDSRRGDDQLRLFAPAVGRCRDDSEEHSALRQPADEEVHVQPVDSRRSRTACQIPGGEDARGRTSVHPWQRVRRAQRARQRARDPGEG
jgi:hypothetical protein